MLYVRKYQKACKCCGLRLVTRSTAEVTRSLAASRHIRMMYWSQGCRSSEDDITLWSAISAAK